MTKQAESAETRRKFEAEPELIGLPFSPWSERARWALDHHRIAYRFVRYVPVLGELALRARLRRFRGKVTVPVYANGDLLLDDSTSIVAYAERVGKGAKLISTAHAEAIEAWSARTERALGAMRNSVVRAMGENPEALREQVPRAIPSALKLPIARFGTAAFRRKYELDARSLEDDLRILEETLATLRDALAGGTYVLREFSYADILMATMMQGISPVADRFIRFSPAMRACWTRPQLAEKFADLVGWRDRLYDLHRNDLHRTQR